MMKFKLVDSNFLTRYHCNVCGGHTEKVPILCMSDEGARICEACLETRDFDAKLRNQIEGLKSHIADLRGLVGQIDAPTFEEWERACQVHDDALRQEYENEAGQLTDLSGETIPDFEDEPF